MELLQYTGLKDVQPVDVYEGDIIWIAGRFAPIEFGGDAFCSRDKGRAGAAHPKVPFKVTGNIYENRDLLEQAG